MIFVFFLLFLLVILVPELFRKLRETPRKNSHRVASKSVGFCTSYVQKTKNICVKCFVLKPRKTKGNQGNLGFPSLFFGPPYFIIYVLLLSRFSLGVLIFSKVFRRFSQAFQSFPGLASLPTLLRP